MCINDWRLGRLIRSQAREYSLGVGGTLAIQADQNRVGISFMMAMGATASSVTISVGGVSLVSLAQFEQLEAHFTLATHGDLPTRDFIVARRSGTALGSVVEYFAPADYLAAGLREFETLYGIALAQRR